MKRIIKRIIKSGLQAALLLGGFSGMAQLPECDKIYFCKYNISFFALGLTPDIYTYDPFAPVSATNPSLNTISLPPGKAGLAVSKVLGSGSDTRTFYTIDVVTDLLWYYDPVSMAWVNTGHQVGNGGQTANLGAGGDYLYAGDPLNGEIYRYDGTGNAVLVTTVTDWSSGGSGSAYDIVADCEGNFYLFRARSTTLNPLTYLRKYSPGGVLLQSWGVVGSTNTLNIQNGYGRDGFRILNNKLYTDAYSSAAGGVRIVAADMTATAVDLANAAVTGPLPPYEPSFVTNEWAACDVTNLISPEITISASETERCGVGNVSFWVSSLQNQGDAPAYQWLVNGAPVPGATDSVYTYMPQNGDVITCQLTSSKPCILSNAATSNAVAMTIDNAVQPELRYSPNAFCTNREEAVLPVINTSGGTFSAAQGLDIDPVTGQVNASLSVPGEYVVTYTNPVPVVCPQYSTATVVNVYPPADASIEMERFKQPVCLGDSVVLHAPEVKGSIYYWEPAERIIGMKDEATAVAGRKEPGFITLTVWGKGLCMDRDSVWIDEGRSCCRLFIPNAFSPNGDGLNDEIAIDTRELQAVNNFRIYNRYGQMVFETGNAKTAWDGTSKGKLCEPGVYYYLLSYTCDDGMLMQEKGDITLVR